MTTRRLLLALLLTAATSCSSEEPAPEPQPASAASAGAKDDRTRAEKLAARLAPAFDQVERAFQEGATLTEEPLLEAAGRAPLVTYCGIEEAERLDPARIERIMDGPLEGSFSLPEHRLEAGVYRTPAPGPSVRGAGIVLWRVFERRLPGRLPWACLFVPAGRVDELIGAR